MSKKGNGFSAKRFLADTSWMCLEARGLAITLICHRMAKGELPTGTDALARLAGAYPEELEKHWHDIATVVFPGECPDARKQITPEAVGEVCTETIAGQAGDELSATETFAVVQEVMAAYVDHHPMAKPGIQDEKRIRARLKDGFSMSDLMLAIEGCHKSPHHCGDNERNRKYQNFELIMRNPDKVSMFISLACDVSENTSTRERSTVTAAQSLLDMEFGDDA